MDVSENLENCPNCGKAIVKSDESKKDSVNSATKCSNCGVELKDDDTFCPSCGTKVETKNDDELKCENCGSPIPENTLFCSICGTKVENTKVVKTIACPNCGNQVEEGTTFCQECGANIFTGDKPSQDVVSSNSFLDNINFNIIVKPAIVALIQSLVLSFTGLLIGFSWFSFVIAIILSVGFFAPAIDNAPNSIVFGLIVGLVLGILETPLVEFTYGAFVAGFYEGFFGGHLLLLIVLGVIIAYVSNTYFKDNILNITDNFKGML